MEIPAFMLKKLYRKGSLKNEAAGASFIVKNAISPATVIGLELQIDGQAYDPAEIDLQAGATRMTAGELGPENPLPVAMNEEIAVALPGISLESGLHEIVLVINTRDVGPLTLEVSDEVN